MTKQTPDETAETTRAGADAQGTNRGRLYEFLSYMFTQNPGEEFIDHLTSEEQIAKLDTLGRVLGENRRAERLHDNIEALLKQIRSLRRTDRNGIIRLREDYVRILRGVSKQHGPPPPYESVYRSGSLMSDHASEVLTIFRQYGLEVKGTEPPDHIGFELAFMGHLCNKEEEYLIEGNFEMADSLASSQTRFLSDHVLKWVPQFCNEVLKYDNGLYGALASLTASWLDLEERRLNEERPNSP